MWSGVLSWTGCWMCWYSYIHYLLYSLKMLSPCSAGLHTMQGPVPRVSHCQDWEWPSAWPTENTHLSLAVYEVCLLQMPLDLLWLLGVFLNWGVWIFVESFAVIQVIVKTEIAQKRLWCLFMYFSVFFRRWLQSHSSHATSGCLSCC